MKNANLSHDPVNHPSHYTQNKFESIDEMNFLTVADFPYTSKATKYFESRGAICYRANNRTSGKTLYLIPTITDIEHFLMSPSYLYEHKKDD